MSSLNETAHHEAAHAVAAEILLGARGVGVASIVPNAADHSLGHVSAVDRSETTGELWGDCLAEDIVCRVGEIAGARISGVRQPYALSDLEGLVGFGAIASLSAPDGEELPDRAAKLADALVTLTWPTITELAVALIQAGELSGDQVRWIIRCSWPLKITVRSLDGMVRFAELVAGAELQIKVSTAVTLKVAVAELDNWLRQREREKHAELEQFERGKRDLQQLIREAVHGPRARLRA